MALFDTIRAGASGAVTGYEIDRSLRFNGETDDAYLKRTSVSSVTNQQIWTMSLWIKRDGIVNGNDMELLFGNDYNTAAISTRGFQFAVGRNDFKLETFDGASGMGQNISTGIYRDCSAWMHIVVRCDTTQGTQSNRMRVYTNGTDIGLGNSISQNQNLTWNKASREQYLGSHAINGGATRFFRGYIAEAHFVDGQSLDPTNFAETDDTTGFYQPIEYAGTYGNNGWYLAFTDNSNTTSTTLGKDYSGNSNNFTPYNFVTGDAVKDTPTNNFCTWNINDPEGRDSEFTEGNLKCLIANQSSNDESGANFAVSSGKWYWEEYMQTSTDNAGNVGVGVKDVDNGNFWRVRGNGGESNHNGTEATVSGLSWTNGDIIGILLDLDNSSWKVSKNGTLINTNIHTNVSGKVTPVMHNSNSSERHTFITNFGQDSSFAGTKTAQGYTDGNGKGDFHYSVPSGYLALCSANLSEPTVPKGNPYFDVVTYTGTGSQRAVTGYNFAPDWVWAKRRNSNNYHILANTVLGANNYMVSNETDPESVGGGTQLINGFNSDGFDVGTEHAVNHSGSTYVGWCWNAGGSTVTNTTGSISAQVRANATAGFSIVSYTGNSSSGATVGHGLGAVPKMIVVKSRSQSRGWNVYHVGIGNTKYIQWQQSGAENTNSAWWNNTTPSSTTFTVGNDNDVNDSSQNYIAYVFADILGYSKFGLYNGNGNSDGSFIFTGFRPRYVTVKRADSGNHWVIYDSARSTTNVMDDYLRMDESAAESTTSQVDIDFYANGFKFRSGYDIVNAGSGRYIYMAFGENAFKYARAR